VKRIAFFLVILAAFVIPASADMMSMYGSSSGTTGVQGTVGSVVGFGYYNINGTQVGTFNWHPNFKLGYYAIGVDVNVPLGSEHPQGFENVVLRSAEYDDGFKGLTYGVLNNVTYGWGMVMKGYSTNTNGPSQLSNIHTGVKGYYNWDTYGAEGMATWSHVYAMRFTQKTPYQMLKFGETIVGDQGMAVKDSSGLVHQHSAVNAWGLDASMPMTFGGDVFTELAGLSNGSTGFQAGYKWGLDFFIANFNVQAAYRSLGDKYIPNYFGPEYESNPIDIASAESFKGKTGYAAEMTAAFMDIASAGIYYESYGDKNTTLSGALMAKVDPYIFKGYYSQPDFVDFRSTSFEDGAVMGLTLGYKLNPVTTLLTNYKQYYDSGLGQVVCDRSVEMQFGF